MVVSEDEAENSRIENNEIESISNLSQESTIEIENNAAENVLPEVSQSLEKNLTFKEITEEKIDTTENCIKELPTESKTEELQKNLEDTESFEAITEKQYQLFGNNISTENNFSQEKEIKKETKVESSESENITLSDAISPNPEKILSDTEIIDEIKETENIYEPKTVSFDFSQDMGKFETALEIKYSSLKLSQLPIKISNIPEGMTFPNQVVIGNTGIKIGNDSINNCHLRIVSNESIKMLEVKHREFKLGLSVSLNNDTIKAYGSVRSYEISSLIKNSRMLKVLEMLEKIFSGAPISFKVNNLYGDITAEDRIELMRIKTVQHFFETLNKSGYKFQADKLPECENIYYLLELNAALRENRMIETWCNFNFKNENYNLHEGDFLIIKRKHKVDKNLVIEEKITLRNPLEKNNIFKEKTAGYRKPCLIELSKLEN